MVRSTSEAIAKYISHSKAIAGSSKRQKPRQWGWAAMGSMAAMPIARAEWPWLQCPWPGLGGHGLNRLNAQGQGCAAMASMASMPTARAEWPWLRWPQCPWPTLCSHGLNGLNAHGQGWVATASIVSTPKARAVQPWPQWPQCPWPGLGGHGLNGLNAHGRGWVAMASMSTARAVPAAGRAMGALSGCAGGRRCNHSIPVASPPAPTTLCARGAQPATAAVSHKALGWSSWALVRI